MKIQTRKRRLLTTLPRAMRKQYVKPVVTPMEAKRRRVAGLRPARKRKIY